MPSVHAYAIPSAVVTRTVRSHLDCATLSISFVEADCMGLHFSWDSCLAVLISAD